MFTWPEFLSWRAARAAVAVAAVGAARSGDLGPASALLRGFAPADAPARALAARLLATGPRLRPPGWLVASALGADPPPPGPDLPGRAAAWIHRRALQARYHLGPAVSPPTEEAALAWALDELHFTAGEIERRHRDAWRARDWPEDEAWDARALRLWRLLLQGDLRALQERMKLLRALVLKPMARAFAQEVDHAGLAPLLAGARRAELESTLFYRLALPPRGRALAATLFDLALRVIESAGEGPMRALADWLPEPSLGGLAACAATRGEKARQCAELLEPGLQRPAGRALALWEAIREDRGALDRGLDLRTALSLISAWTWPARAWSPDPSWGVVLANRGRARSRLRAYVMNGPPEPLIAALAALPGLAARTRAAARWSGTDQARRERPLGYALGLDTPPLPPCDPPDPPLHPLTEADAGAVDTWLLLVALKDRWENVQPWALEGRSFRDATWGRLIGLLPGRLTDAGRRGARDASYDRLRLFLRATWSARLSALRERLARLPTRHRPSASGHVWLEALRTDWSSEVPMPRADFDRLLKNALRLRRKLDRELP